MTGKLMGHNPENWDMTGKGGHDPFSREKGHVPLFVSLGFSGYVPIFHVPVFRIVSLKSRLSPGKR